MNGMRKTAKRLRRGAHARAGGLAGVVRENPLLAGVAGIGFSVSFQTVAHLARAHGLPGPSVLYPVGIDVGILALITEGLHLIRAGRSDFVPRVLAWVLTGFTIYVNVHGSAAGDRVGAALHAVMPGLWVVCLELVRHRRVAQARTDGVPLGRWVAAPWPTLTLWMRMRRDGIESYPLALELEQARWFARDLIRATPPQYRPRRSSLVCKKIRSGRLREDVRRAVASSLADGGTPGWEGPVTEWITGAVGLTERLAASLENSRRDMTERALGARPEPVPEAIPAPPAATGSSMPEAAPEATPEPRPKARLKQTVKPALKLAASKSRSMSPDRLAEHAQAMLEEYGSVSVNRIKQDLSVGTDKARAAHRIVCPEKYPDDAGTGAEVVQMEARRA